jgi:hypothetical protein
MADSMLVLARNLRGSSRMTDALLPLSILNVAQAGSLMNGLTMALVLSSLLAIALILAAGAGRWRDGRAMALIFGLALVLLPLTGGGGLAMTPPLGLWLVGYIARGWWSGRVPGAATRAISLGLLATASAIVLLYLHGYTRPPHNPLPPSPTLVASTMLRYLSLAIYPGMSGYWWPAGLIVSALVTATLLLLTSVVYRTPAERPRALGLIAVILSMLCVAAAVGFSRAGFGPNAGLASRYVTLAVPLLCVLYFAWLTYANGRIRIGIHVGLLTLICATLPNTYHFSLSYGRTMRVDQYRVERGLKDHAPTAEIVRLACPSLYPDPQFAKACLHMLKQARVGAFADYEEDRVASSPAATGAIQR